MGCASIDVAVKTCKIDDEYETAEKFLEEARELLTIYTVFQKKTDANLSFALGLSNTNRGPCNN